MEQIFLPGIGRVLYDPIWQRPQTQQVLPSVGRQLALARMWYTTRTCGLAHCLLPPTPHGSHMPENIVTIFDHRTALGTV